jgi:hypothetical protein
MITESNINTYCTLGRNSRKSTQNQQPSNSKQSQYSSQLQQQENYLQIQQQTSRKSISMESIPSNIPNHQQQPTESKLSKIERLLQQNNTYQKYGTVTGFSSVVPSARPSILLDNSNKDSILNESNGQNASQSLANSQRMRAINRSFRTAVDKSFDINSATNNQQQSNSKGNFIFLINLFLGSKRKVLQNRIFL